MELDVAHQEIVFQMDDKQVSNELIEVSARKLISYSIF